jgi:tetratricopeptide (TPR) repeat protein
LSPRYNVTSHLIDGELKTNVSYIKELISEGVGFLLHKKLFCPVRFDINIKSALPFGSAAELRLLGRQLLAAKNPQAALEIFKSNYDKNPKQFIRLTEMARGLSANGDYTKALEFAKKALPLAQNYANKLAVQAMIEKMKTRKDIN